MTDRDSLVRAVMLAAGGEVVGRIRLQKIVYLLEQLGLSAGLRFAYHHYGPYSRELSDALDWLEAEGVIEEQTISAANGSYSIYRLKAPAAAPPETVGSLPWDRACGAIAEMKQPTSPVIELAATIHWLRHKERVENWRKELKVRKPQKATDARIDEAEALLRRLALAA